MPIVKVDKNTLALVMDRLRSVLSKAKPASNPARRTVRIPKEQPK